jgi:hypothetical protein
MMTVHKCQAVVVAERWRNPILKLMAIIVASVSVEQPSCTARTERPAATRCFHDVSPDDDGETEKQNRFDDHAFDTFRPSIED